MGANGATDSPRSSHLGAAQGNAEAEPPADAALGCMASPSPAGMAAGPTMALPVRIHMAEAAG